MRQIFTALKIILNQPFYRNIAIVTSAIVAYISYWLLTQTTTIPMFIDMVKNKEFGEHSLIYGIVYLITTFLMIILSGISVSIMAWLFKHSVFSKGKTLGGANIGGFAAGMVGMGCPVCGAFLLSAIGVTGGLTIFPLQGLELKFLSIGLLTVSSLYGASKITKAPCEECNNFTYRHSYSAIDTKSPTKSVVMLPLEKILVFVLAGVFLINQLLITQVTTKLGLSSSRSFVTTLFGIKTKAAYTIIAPKLNPDGITTSLAEQPTITEVSANPNTGDALSDAKVVMIPTGKPFYAPDDISFDDPINAQKKWQPYEHSIKLSSDKEASYQKLISTFPCSYCCGSPTRVTLNKQCGCAHARAARGYFKYMLQNYADKYTDDQILGEAARWWAIWYPKGMLEDYLLTTGKSDDLPHHTHGGAGADGRHGL